MYHAPMSQPERREPECTVMPISPCLFTPTSRKWLPPPRVANWMDWRAFTAAVSCASPLALVKRGRLYSPVARVAVPTGMASRSLSNSRRRAASSGSASSAGRPVFTWHMPQPMS